MSLLSHSILAAFSISLLNFEVRGTHQIFGHPPFQNSYPMELKAIYYPIPGNILVNPEPEAETEKPVKRAVLQLKNPTSKFTS